MSWWRPVDSRIRGDEKFRRLSTPPPNAQTLWIHILTRPGHQIPGIMEAGELTLADELGWSGEAFRKAFGKAFQEVLDEGLAKADAEARVIYLPNALRTRAKDGPRPQSPNVLRGWAKPFESLPDSPLKDMWLQQLKGFAEDLGEAFAKAFQEAFGKAFATASRITQGQDQGKDQEVREEKESDADSAVADPDALERAERLRTLILENDPGAKRPALTVWPKWITAIERLHRLDGRSWEEIDSVIDWCQGNEFWKSNILSGPKLREKFPVLRGQMLRDDGGGSIIMGLDLTQDDEAT